MEAEGTEGIAEVNVAVEKPGRKSTRKRSIIIFIVVSLLNVALLGLLWSQLLTPAHNADTTQGVVSPLVGKPAPSFTLDALSARSASAISLASFKGRAVVINVWNSTCAPCMQEAPLLQAEWQRVQRQGQAVVFLGIDFQDARSDGLSFLQKYGITYPNVLDASGSVAISYGVSGTPETIFINRRGVVVQKVIGELTAQTLESNLQLVV